MIRFLLVMIEDLLVPSARLGVYMSTDVPV